MKNFRNIGFKQILQRRSSAAALLSLSSLSWPALAVSLALSGPASAADAYKVGPGDVLQISVFGEARLSGKFRVGPDGSIIYPLVGAISVGDMPIADIVGKLQAGLSERMPANAPPTVEVAEYAPVFVLGEIEKPGPVAFNPGMTVLELSATAGGVRRAKELDDWVMPLIGVEQELNDLRLVRYTNIVQRARLLAELKAEPFKSDDVPLDPLVGAEASRRVVDDEVALFQIRQTVLNGQEQALTAQKASYDPEIVSLKQAIELYDEEQRLLGREVETQENLFRRGLAVESRLLGLKREYSALQRSVLESRSFLARAIQRQLEVEQRLSELRDVRSRENAGALRDTNVLIARTEQRMASVGASIAELRERGGATPVASTLVYTLIRREGDGHVLLTAEELTTVRPRDIVRIERRTPPRATTIKLTQQ